MIFKPSIFTSHLKFFDRIGFKWFKNQVIWRKYTVDIQKLDLEALINFTYEIEKSGKRSNLS